MGNQGKNQIDVVTNKILYKFNAISGTSEGKATFAKLRNSIGKPLSETIEVWSLLFEYLPEEFLGIDQKISSEEKAILTTLQLYALHQQGLSTGVLMENEEGYKNIGYSLKNMRKGDDIVSTDRRFNAMITSSSFEELIYHLRHMIKLLKSRSPEIRINYAKLSKDLYWFLRGYDEKLRLAWAREYYRKDYKGENNHAKE